MLSKMKICPRCKQKKLITLFNKNKAQKNGLQAYCAKCSIELQAEKRIIPENRAAKLVMDAKRKSKERELEFDISKVWVKEKLEIGVCELTGFTFDFMPSKDTYANKYAPSLDRKDSKKGYTKDNVRVVLWSVNCALGQYDDDEMLPILKAMVKAIEKNATQNTASPVPTGSYPQSKEHTKHGAVPTPGAWEDNYDANHHRGAVYRENPDHSAQTGSGDSVAHRNKKVEPSRTFESREDDGDSVPEVGGTEFTGGRVFD